jgi:hypothetical protein
MNEIWPHRRKLALRAATTPDGKVMTKKKRPVHVYPLTAVPHIIRGTRCWCRPIARKGIILHRARACQ